MEFIDFDRTVRILNHRGFCARLVRSDCVPDTGAKILLIHMKRGLEGME